LIAITGGVTNRDWASLFWLGVVCVWLLRKSDIGSGLIDILKTWKTPKLSIPTTLLFVYAGGEITLGSHLGLWKHDLIRDSVVWTIGPAIGLLFGVGDAGSKPHFFRDAALRTLKFAVFVEFYLNLTTFSLPAELVLVPVITVVTLLAVFTGTDEQYKQVRTFLNWLSIFIGFGLLIVVSTRLVENWHHIDAVSDLRQFALPVWLTVGLLPYIYALTLWASYESLFVRIRFATEDPAARRRAKRALLLYVNFRVQRVSDFGYPWLRRITAASSFAEARRVAREYRAVRPDTDDTQSDP
jgi:hypothetical protein